MSRTSARRPARREFRFDPDRIAELEAAGWRAYYERKWLRLLWLVLTLCQDQFHIPFPVSVVAAWYVVRASVAWAPVAHDVKKVQANYAKFYRLARRYSGLTFDPVRVAALELRYTDDHRRLVDNPDKREFVETMTQLHSVVFGITPEQARESAEHRVEANNIVDTITGKTSMDPERDWRRLEDELRACYRSIQTHLPLDGEP
jgi:hypothetical protein